MGLFQERQQRFGWPPGRLEPGLAVADEGGGIAADQVDELLHLGLTGRLLEIFPDGGLDALLAQQLERLPRLAATRVVPDGDGHLLDLPSPFLWGGVAVIR